MFQRLSSIARDLRGKSPAGGALFRLLLCAFLGGSFLTVQAHVVRRRVERRDEAVVATHHIGKRRREDQGGAHLGGGTTRALYDASDLRWREVASASASCPVSRAVGSSVQRAPLLVAEAPGRGSAPPILRI